MLEKKDIKDFQEILMNSWPAHHYYFLNGWIMRFTDGVTSRANSVFPVNYTGNLNAIDEDIEFVEKAYNMFNLPAMFTLPDYFEPKDLEEKLLEHGYREVGCITYTMISPIQQLRKETINRDITFNFYSKRINKFSKFLAKYSSRNQNAQVVLNALVKRIIIPKIKCIIAELNNTVVGTLMGILDPHGFLYIVDMLVHPEFRQQKIATSMFWKLINEWGIKNGAKTIWLQVESENVKAVKLYFKLGFEKAYSYRYFAKTLKR
ncbi:MAG: GNAT family N-acetyltransferase [Candidatus Thorarchaeota archaeon]